MRSISLCTTIVCALLYNAFGMENQKQSLTISQKFEQLEKQITPEVKKEIESEIQRNQKEAIEKIRQFLLAKKPRSTRE